jgi:hypothetical protein
MRLTKHIEQDLNMLPSYRILWWVCLLVLLLPALIPFVAIMLLFL